MTNSVIFILGTSRATGNTRKFLDAINANYKAPVIDLADYNVAPYDYNYKNKDDDFSPLIKQILNYKTIVFATPIYWYAMSSQLKKFIDRFSDLVRVEKQAGRAMAGRRIFLVVTGTDENLPMGYEEPFRLTSKYLNMEYCGAFYSCIRTDLQLETETIERVSEIAKLIFAE